MLKAFESFAAILCYFWITDTIVVFVNILYETMQTIFYVLVILYVFVIFIFVIFMFVIYIGYIYIWERKREMFIKF